MVPCVVSPFVMNKPIGSVTHTRSLQIQQQYGSDYNQISCDEFMSKKSDFVRNICLKLCLHLQVRDRQVCTYRAHRFQVVDLRRRNHCIKSVCSAVVGLPTYLTLQLTHCELSFRCF